VPGGREANPLRRRSERLQRVRKGSASDGRFAWAPEAYGYLSNISNKLCQTAGSTHPRRPVMFPPGRSSRGTMRWTTGIGRARKDDRDRPRLPLEGDGRRGPVCQDDVGLQADQLLRECSHPIDVSDRRTNV
jgi:hypothetical protein